VPKHHAIVISVWRGENIVSSFDSLTLGERALGLHCTGRGSGWPQDIWTYWWRHKHIHLPGMEPRSSSP